MIDTPPIHRFYPPTAPLVPVEETWLLAGCA